MNSLLYPVCKPNLSTLHLAKSAPGIILLPLHTSFFSGRYYRICFTNLTPSSSEFGNKD
jgi:hypothetical protein